MHISIKVSDTAFIKTEEGTEKNNFVSNMAHRFADLLKMHLALECEVFVNDDIYRNRQEAIVDLGDCKIEDLMDITDALHGTEIVSPLDQIRRKVIELDTKDYDELLNTLITALYHHRPEVVDDPMFKVPGEGGRDKPFTYKVYGDKLTEVPAMSLAEWEALTKGEDK